MKMAFFLLVFIYSCAAFSNSFNHSLHCVSKAVLNGDGMEFDEIEVGWFNTETSDFHTDRYTYTHVVKGYPLRYSTKFIIKKGKPLFVYELLNPEFRSRKKRRITTKSKFDEDVGFGISFGGNIKKKDGTPLQVQLVCGQYKKTKIKK